MTLLNILLMGPPQGESSTMTTVFMLGSIMLVFYFFMLRPQMQKTKKQKAFKESVKKGDKVVTIGGIHGKIAEIREAVFIIDIENGGKMKIEKSAISMDYSDSGNKKD